MRKRFRYRSAIIAVNLALAAARTAQALTITATYDGTFTGDPNAAAIEATINSAIITYESLLLNPVSVSVTFSEVTTGLGGSSTARATDTYSDFLAKLTASAKSTADATAVAHLPVQANNPVDGNANMSMSTPDARALGIFTGHSLIGGNISLNISAMNVTRGGAYDASKYDLFAVVSHELDEVLGLGSALVGGNNGHSPPVGLFTPVLPEDLFRYNQAGARSFDYNAGTTAYFSLDGTTRITQFNQNSTSSTNADFGDWASSGTPQIQDAFGTPGATVNLGVSEKTALDVIGYTLLTSLTWNPNSTTAGTPPDGAGVWTTASGANWWNGASNSIWVNSPVQNAQFGTPGTASTLPCLVTLGSPITAGTIVFANANYTIGTLGGGNSLTINNGVMAAVNATINANVVLGGANTWEVASAVTLAVGGNISGGFGLTKQGPGTLALSGSNSYSGGTIVNAGTLSLLSAAALPFGGNVTLSGGALDLNGQSPSIGNLSFGDGASTSAATLIDSAVTKGTLTLGGDITYTETSNSGVSSYFPAAVISANLQLASGTHTITSADSTLALNYDVVISGVLSGVGGITKSGANTYLALNGSNTYSGATIINNGYLFAAATNTLSTSSAVTINSPGVLDLNPASPGIGVTTGSYNQTIASLAGNGQVTLGSAILSIGNDTTSTTYSGSIFGTGGITKIGADTLTLTGSSGYTGATVINAGILQLGDGTTRGFIDSSSGVSGLAAGTLAFNYSSSTAFAVPISGAISVTTSGAGVAFLQANNSYSGTTTINGGSGIVAGNNATAGTLGTGNVTNNGTLFFERSDSVAVPNQISGNGVLVQAGAGTVTLSGNSSGFTGQTQVTAGTLLVSGSISGSTAIIFNGGALAGTGTVGPVTAQSGGTVLPGSSTGSGLLSTGTFSLQSGAHLSLDLGGTANTGLATTQYSELNVTGSVTLGGDLQITLFGGYTPAVNDIFYIILNDGNDIIANKFSNAPTQGSLVTFGSVQYKVNYFANGDANPITSNDVSLQVMAVPEPGACTLLLSGLGLAAGFTRRRVRGGVME